MRAKTIMIQGTTSGAGKSLIAAGLCRIFAKDGLRVAPFKGQNMALNSCVTADGRELARSQYTQAQCAGVPPDARMNPVLLKPTGDRGSELVVLGRPVGEWSARDYYARKHALVGTVREAFESLAAEHDVVVIEGAGSPAEINLKEDDIANMGLARMVGAPVLLAGDIDRGGVFAALAGTHLLLEPPERALLRGVIINKFQGDEEILAPGLRMLEEIIERPVLGVLPYMKIDLPEEDSLSERLAPIRRSEEGCVLDIAVVRLPRLAQFTDFDALSAVEGVSLRYIDAPQALCGRGAPDLVILPGSGNAQGDLGWLRESGLAGAMAELVAQGAVLLGLGGGYRMLRELGLLPGGGAQTGGSEESRRVSGRIAPLGGALSAISGARLAGYALGGERLMAQASPFALLEPEARADGAFAGNVYGSEVHGLLEGEVLDALLRALLARRGLPTDTLRAADPAVHRERQFDLLERTLRASLDLEQIYRILEEGVGG